MLESTPEEDRIVAEHFRYLQELTEQDIAARITGSPANPFHWDFTFSAPPSAVVPR